MATTDPRTAAALAVFRHTSEAVAVVAVDPDAGSRVVDANQRLAELTGYDLGEIVGRPLEELQPDAVVVQFSRRIEEALASGAPLDYQVERHVPAGRRTYHATLCPLPELGSDPPYVVSMIRDITALRRLTDTLGTLQRAADVGYWTWDVVSDEITWSTHLYTIFGLDPDTFDADYADYLARVHDDDRDRISATIQDALDSATEVEFEHRIVTPAGETRHLRCHAHPTATTDDDTVVRMTGTAQRIPPPG